MTWQDDKAEPVKGSITEDFRVAMQQPKVSVCYYFSGDDAYTMKEIRDKLAPDVS